jgi:hypothetical protein
MMIQVMKRLIELLEQNKAADIRSFQGIQAKRLRNMRS